MNEPSRGGSRQLKIRKEVMNMCNCETCRDNEWCSSEEMDREECPVRPEVNLTSLISELCNDYCRSCALIYKSSGCTDCTCARVREILEGGKNV